MKSLMSHLAPEEYPWNEKSDRKFYKQKRVKWSNGTSLVKPKGGKLQGDCFPVPEGDDLTSLKADVLAAVNARGASTSKGSVIIFEKIGGVPTSVWAIFQVSGRS